MHTLITVCLAGLLIGASGFAHAESSTVFKTRDANGNPVFSDQAPEDAEEIKVDAPQTFEAPSRSRFELGSRQEQPIETGPMYERLEILSPEHDTAFRNNAGNVTVQIALTPALQGNHTLELVVDGRVLKRQKSAGPVLLENLDRGTHQFQARVVEDESGETLQTSNSVTATLQRISIIPRAN